MANDIIVDDGLDEILRRLVGLSVANTLFCAVGTDRLAPVGTQTALRAEVAGARVPVSTYLVSGGVATIKSFFNTSQANAIVGEHGLFIKSAPGAAGDIMIDRGIEVSGLEKKTTQEMIVEKVITLSRGEE